MICLKGFSGVQEDELIEGFEAIMPLLSELKKHVPVPKNSVATWEPPPETWKALYHAVAPLKNYYNSITLAAFAQLEAEVSAVAVVEQPKCKKCGAPSVLKVGKKTPAYFGCQHCFHHGAPLCVQPLSDVELQELLSDEYIAVHTALAALRPLWKDFENAAGDIKQHHHCHVAGNTFGATHFICNILASYKNYKTPCFAHFALAYDHAWPIQFASTAIEVINEFKAEIEAATVEEDDDGDQADDAGFPPVAPSQYKSTEFVESEDDSSNDAEDVAPAPKRAKKASKPKPIAPYTNIIGDNSEKLKAFVLWRLVQFNDSFLHLPEPLSTLTDRKGLNHKLDCKDTIELLMSRYDVSYAGAFRLVSAGKAHFPHDAHNSATFLDEATELSPLDAFFNRKNTKALTEEDYRFCQWVWRTFKCSTSTRAGQ